MEFGAFRCAPLSTPTPSRSTSSPPNHPLTNAKPTATNDNVSAAELGFCGAGRRINQLPMKSSTTTTLPAPCHKPIAFALVPCGIAHQSTKPKTAASNPPIIPAAIIQKEIANQELSPVLKPTMSNAAAV